MSRGSPTRPDLLYASPALPAASHDITCARTHGLLDALAACRTLVLADKGYHGAPAGIWTSFVASRRDPGTALFTRRELSWLEKAVNAAHAKLRAHGERERPTEVLASATPSPDESRTDHRPRPLGHRAHPRQPLTRRFHGAWVSGCAGDVKSAPDLGR